MATGSGRPPSVFAYDVRRWFLRHQGQNGEQFVVSAIVRSLALGKWSILGGCLLGRLDLSFRYVVNVGARYAKYDASFLVPVVEERGVFPT